MTVPPPPSHPSPSPPVLPSAFPHSHTRPLPHPPTLPSAFPHSRTRLLPHPPTRPRFLNRPPFLILAPVSFLTRTQVTIIIDCRGLGWQHFHLPALRYLLAFETIDQDNYPERLCRAFVVNAPAVFTTIWAVLKRGLDKRILDKVFILGKNYEEELQKFIAPENLPDFLGGKCTCSHMPNGCVPCLQPERLAALDRLKQYVSARDAFRLDIVVEEVRPLGACAEKEEGARRMRGARSGAVDRP